jgi:hypothetical protein
MSASSGAERVALIGASLAVLAGAWLTANKRFYGSAAGKCKEARARAPQGV